ncbi:hypothetical protein B0H14DRAFT_3018169, partial [Mycena olivaceomarginata]
ILLLACSQLLWRDLLAMDVHRSRAECMLRLGDIHKRCNDLLKAVGPLGNCKDLCLKGHHRQNRLYRLMKGWQVLAEDVHQQHRENLVKLAEL